MRTGWRLGVILVLLAATAAVLHTAPPVKGAVNPFSLFALPTAFGAWVAADGVPEDILPLDPNEKLSVRRTYREGDQLAWVSVGLFVGQDDETRRASINRIYPQRGVNRIEPVPFAVSLAGSNASPITLPTVIIHQGSRRLLVTYWHQLGNRAYGGEYRFRLALMRDLIFTRRADTLLVRIATPMGPALQTQDGLALLSGLAPSVYAAFSHHEVAK
jgi:EpsI family protein